MLTVLLLGASALAHALLFPPWEQAWLSWIALAPFLWVIRRQPPWRAFVCGLLWGHATHWPIASWVMDAVRVYFGQSWIFGFLFGMAASILFWTPYYGLFAAGAAWLSARVEGVLEAVLLAALWVTLEFARAHVWVGSTWMLLGYALQPSPVLRQAADIGGVYLLSFAIVLSNAALAILLDASKGRSKETPVTRRASPVMRPALLVTALLSPFLLAAYGVWRLQTPLPTTPAVPVAVVQGNNEAGARWQPGSYGQGLDSYLELSRQAAQQGSARVIVWPEAAVPVFIAREPEYQAQIERLLRETDTELILGAPHFENSDPAVPVYFNSAFVVHADGLLPLRYDKQHLMPFTEYFPWHTLSFLRRRFENVRAFSTGVEDTELPTRLGRSAIVICFEADFPDLVRRRMARGAEVLVNLSNDVWLGSGRGQQQHLTMAALRAVENRTWMIRATTTGVSAIVDPFGTIVTRAPSLQPAILHATVTPMQISTLYKEYGDVFAYVCVFIVGLAVVLLAARAGVQTSSQQRPQL
ncbi:MAG: apolipoprotein N-acyltransferase [Deltaproteobacteria bacterium]|nr:apolipoprotein N-acyltransferase [Deltaproteobacteria bacterium]